MAGRYTGEGFSAKVHRTHHETLYKRVRAIAERNDRQYIEEHGSGADEPQNGVKEHSIVLNKTVEIGCGHNLNDKEPWMPPSDWFVKYCEAYDRLKKEVKHAKRTSKSSKTA